MSSTTSVSLLGRVREGDEQAWECFDRRYRPVLRTWCRNLGVPDRDIDDVVQEVMMALVKALQTFERRGPGSLRGFLRTIADRKWTNLLRARYQERGGITSSLELLEGVAAGEDLQQRLTREYDLELFERAVAAVRCKFAPQVFEAYRLTALEPMTAPEAQKVLNIPAATILVFKWRVGKAIQEEVRRLEEAAE
ncbi:MAG TPA: sigma-70 family RNA polymerase sigma factor [Gemmataceae bacterium]|jgi:RNA polymerase sigma factor (sigma-70 family)|nr:sigma-70 family RNA polymerase sigma factor [Gemmataceae bacterium]